MSLFKNTLVPREDVMRIEDSFCVNVPVDKVWNLLLDTKAIAPCIPGCEEVREVDDQNYTALMNVKIGPIRARFALQIKMLEMQAPEFIKSNITGKDSKVASSLKASSELRLKAIGPTQTEIFYTTDVSVLGRLGQFGEGVMQKKAKEMGESFAGSLESSLAGTVPVDEESQGFLAALGRFWQQLMNIFKKNAAPTGE